jgi:hypothetical protein
VRPAYSCTENVDLLVGGYFSVADLEGTRRAAQDHGASLSARQARTPNLESDRLDLVVLGVDFEKRK